MVAFGGGPRPVGGSRRVSLSAGEAVSLFRCVNPQKTTPKNLSAKGAISKLVIQALKEIGLNNQTPTEEEKIIELLKKEDPKNLIHDIKIAPVWIQKIMQKAL